MKAAFVLEDIREALGLDTVERAATATETVLTAVGRRMSALAARSLAIELPASWGMALRADTDEAEPGALDPLYAEVAATLQVPVGEGLEMVQVVCQRVGEHVSADARHVLDGALPPAWAALFSIGEQARAVAADPPAGVPPHSRSIAAGEHAPSNKLSTGAPRTTPLADGRVSEGETLAEGRAGSHQPLSNRRPS
jgi:hypothetical protein